MSKYLRKLKDIKSDTERINSKDNFELVYIRHRYFRNSKNPSDSRMLRFQEMAHNIARKQYYMNVRMFKGVGMEVNDLKSIAMVHVVSFISMSGLHENPKLMVKFLSDHKKLKGKTSVPNDKDIFLREAYNLSRFLKQRFFEMVKVCRSKNYNVRGSVSYKGFFKETEHADKDVSDLQLKQQYNFYGYVKITETEFKRLKKEDINIKTRSVMLEGDYLTEEDIKGSYLDPRFNSFNMNPEDRLIISESYRDGTLDIGDM